MSPSNLDRANRRRQQDTVSTEVPKRSAMETFDSPAAAPSTIRARRASLCGVVAAAARCSSTRRSSGSSATTAGGRPRRLCSCGDHRTVSPPSIVQLSPNRLEVQHERQEKDSSEMGRRKNHPRLTGSSVDTYRRRNESRTYADWRTPSVPAPAARLAPSLRSGTHLARIPTLRGPRKGRDRAQRGHGPCYPTTPSSHPDI